MHTQAQSQHRWLQQLLGDWTNTTTMDAELPDSSKTTHGTETVTALGDLWIVGQSRGDMPGGGMADMRMTLGYDADQQRFVGNWVGSMMHTMFVYQGTLDDSQNVLTLDTEGPSFSGDGSTARYQDVITLKGSNERTLHSQTLQPDGSWKRFMVATYQRVSPRS